MVTERKWSKLRRGYPKKNDSRDPDSFGEYMQEIHKFPVLGIVKESELVLKMKSGDELAREEFIKHNLHFVVWVAKWYQHRGLSLPDLICEGNLGLMHAVDKFDLSKGVKFISYAVWWIRQAILTALSKVQIVHGPLNFETRKQQIANFCAVYGEMFDGPPTSAQIAYVFEVSVEEVELGFSGDVISLDYTFPSNGGTDNSLHDLLESEAENPEDSEVRASDLSWIMRTLESLVGKGILNPRHRKFFLLYHGFTESGEVSDEESPTLEEIGLSMGISREAVRLGKVRAEKLLRDALRKEQRSFPGFD